MMIFFSMISMHEPDEPQSVFTLDATPDSFFEEYINDMPPLSKFDPCSALFNMRYTMILNLSFTVLDNEGLDINAWMLQVFKTLKSKPVDSIIDMGLVNSARMLYRRFLISDLLDYKIDGENNVSLTLSVKAEVIDNEH